MPHTYGSKVYVRLNFRLHLHFNCRQVALKKQTLVDCMQSIREFFDREGAFLAAEQEYIHYFALPFVIEPEKHPSFQGLFEVSVFSHWGLSIKDIRSFEHFLTLPHTVLVAIDLSEKS